MSTGDTGEGLVSDPGHHHGHAPPRAHGGATDAHAAGGHDKHAGHTVEMFRDRFWGTLALTIPIVAFSEMVQGWFGYSLPDFPGDELVQPVLGTVHSFPHDALPI